MVPERDGEAQKTIDPIAAGVQLSHVPSRSGVAMPDTTNHPPFQGPSLESLTQPAVLQVWLSKVEVALTARPDDHALLRKRAGLLRGLGRLDEAARAYAALAEETPETDALAAVALTSTGGPVRFVRLTGVLTAGEQQQLWQIVTAPDAHFVPARVGEGDKLRLDPSKRISSLMETPDALRPWFLPRIAELIEREQVLERLGLEPFPVGFRELQVTRHLDGGYYCCHRDANGEGGPSAGRTLTYVYYFHQSPRSFSGGDILLFDHGADDKRSEGLEFTRLEPAHNSLVFFASDRLHEVTKVVCPGSGPLDGRWTVNGWFHRAREYSDEPQ